MERTGNLLSNIDQTALDIKNEFSRCTLQEIQKAISKGSLGSYGVDYKLTTQIVCVWIKKYFQEKNKNKKIL